MDRRRSQRSENREHLNQIKQKHVFDLRCAHQHLRCDEAVPPCGSGWVIAPNESNMEPTEALG